MSQSKLKVPFRTDLARNIFSNKYALTPEQTWYEKSRTIVEDVCGTGCHNQFSHPLMSKEERRQLTEYISEMKFLPGGRYIYYAGRPNRFWNNCLLLKGEDDTREEWSALTFRAMSALMSGAGIGIDYSVFRPQGRILSKTGGEASGPIPLMEAINEIGRNVRQGGSRRCLKFDSIVRTENGMKRIAEVTVGEKIKTENGYKTVLAKECTGERDLLEINTRAGVIVSTPDHRHAVIRSVNPFRIEWVEAQHLTSDETLVFFEDQEHNEGGKQLTPFDAVTEHPNSRPYVRPLVMSTDLAWFIGALCDGSCVERGIVFSQREDNVEFLQKVQRVFKDEFGVDTKLTEGHNTLECRIHRRQLSRDMKRYRAKNEGQLIHDDILNASTEEKLAFIAGVLDADGSVKIVDSERSKGTANMRFACSKDEVWIKDYSKFLSSMGIPNRVTKHSCGSDTTRNPLWVVYLSDKDFVDYVADMLRPHSIKIQKDYEYVGPRNQAAHALVVTRSGHNTPRVLNPMDYRSFSWPEGVIPAKVEKIVKVDSDVTYDIQVEGDENFVANGHLTHNSAIWAGLNWQHEDIEKYLTVKNWDETFIGNTGYTMAEIRTQDFNYPATLDMTNISVLYDDDWLKDPNKNVDPVFLKNIEQALSTGEPGFGFNFGDKANETLRNAPVSGETLVYEKDAGWVYVDDIIGEEVVVWTGIQWASTVFKKTKSNVETIRIELSNGNYIDCDPEHPFITPNWERIDARDLQQGQELLGLDDEVFVEGVVSTGKIEDVYCCDVGVEEHSFCAEGVIISNCTEVTSEDDSDICNLGSVNIGAIESIEEFKNVVHLASKFLICGSIRADVPFDKVAEIREKNRRIGLGLMGMHEWLLKRGYKYEVTPELHQWLAVYRDESERAANEHCDRFFLSRPKGYRAIAPTGSIGTMASTTTGIEPLFATAFKRRYLVGGDRWHYEYVVDATADQIIRETGCDPEQIETANTLAADPERRVKFQADVQDYVDMGISSTLNLPEWGSEHNNPDKVQGFADIVAKYAHRLRGLTTYPDGSRGGQPIIEVPYKEAIENQGVVFEENQESQCKSGVCGI